VYCTFDTIIFCGKEAKKKILQKMIVSKVQYTISHIENSFQLVEKLRSVKLEDRHVLLSLDVVSLFTNIPLDLAIDSVSKRQHFRQL